tara:strand:- start:1399 stop:2490 length:1092 start_codon:yes stop_codon:yes gene_type:complete
MMRRTLQRVRYPPFELGNMDPSSVPVSEVVVDVNDNRFRNFNIGTDDGWFVQWSDYSDDDSDKLHLDCEISNTPPAFLSRSRMGWFVDPDPLHNISRKLIKPTVILLIISLFIHAIEPGLVEYGILSNLIAGSVKIGPLEYPRLLFYTFPLFLLPLLFRTIANFRDISRQTSISRNPILEPKVSIMLERDTANVTIDEIENGITPTRARIQVGVATPERSTLLASLGRTEGAQPSPGMSTNLPEKRVSPGDEIGSGVGESTPMQSTSMKSVILEPLRIMTHGSWVSGIIVGSPFNLSLLEGAQWPGSVYSSLIAIHWEIIIEFVDSDNRKIKWVSPVKMPHPTTNTVIAIAPVISGRAELSNF